MATHLSWVGGPTIEVFFALIYHLFGICFFGHLMHPNDPETISGLTQNDPRMVPKISPNGPQGVAKLSQHGPKMIST